MKKVLSTVLALGIVAGAASMAAAADPVFTMSGFYTLDGIYATNYTATGINKTTQAANQAVNVHGLDPDKTAAFFQQNLRINPKLAVNDKVDMFSEIRLMDDQVWGTGAGSADPNATNNRQLDFKTLYMEYKSPVGKLRAGRVPFGSYGTSQFIDSATSQDGLAFFADIAKPFNATLVYNKLSETDAFAAAANDQDSDYYDGRFGYDDGALNAALSLRTTQNHAAAATTDNKHSIRGFGKYNIDKSMFVEVEFDHVFGNKTVDNVSDVDYQSSALFGHFGGTFSGVSAGVLAWWLTGDDDKTDTTNNAYGHSGADFQPLMIATGKQFGLLNGDRSSIYNTTSAVFAGQNIVQDAGVKAIGAYVSYPVSPELTVVGVLGSAWADNAMAGWDSHMGWEGDVTGSYKLLDNLTYSVGAGYFATGDFFDGPNGALSVHEDSVVLLKNSLNMTF